MSYLALALLEYLHIMAGIIWFGGAIWMKFVVMPAVRSSGPERREESMRHVARREVPTFIIAGATTIVLGVLRGTVFGPLRTWSALFQTAYGNTFLLALAVAMLTAALGTTSGWRTEMSLRRGNSNWLVHGITGMALEWAELVGFATMLACMVLMKFGR